MLYQFMHKAPKASISHWERRLATATTQLFLLAQENTRLLVFQKLEKSDAAQMSQNEELIDPYWTSNKWGKQKTTARVCVWKQLQTVLRMTNSLGLH